jgi:hypothetical protein
METLRKQIRQRIFKLFENYPAGAEFRSDAPWNEKEPNYTEPEGKEEPYVGIFYNKEICILRNVTDNSLWVFYDGAMMNKDNAYRPYAYRDSETGEYELTPDVVARYVNDNLNILKTGSGLNDWEDGVDVVKIDSDLSREIRSTYNSEKLNNILLALS